MCGCVFQAMSSSAGGNGQSWHNLGKAGPSGLEGGGSHREQASQVMKTLHEHGMRPAPHPERLHHHEKMGVGHFARTLAPHLCSSMLTGHAWLRVCFDRRDKAPPRSEIMFLLLVVILGNMFLLALRFDVGDQGAEAESPLAQMHPGAVLFRALETALLSLVLRLLLVFLLKLGRPRPTQPLHQQDELILTAADRVWKPPPA